MYKYIQILFCAIIISCILLLHSIKLYKRKETRKEGVTGGKGKEKERKERKEGRKEGRKKKRKEGRKKGRERKKEKYKLMTQLIKVGSRTRKQDGEKEYQCLLTYR